MNSTTVLPNGYRLIDSAQRAKDHSDTWAHPHQEALDQVETGYFVKVGVTHAELSGERFWGIVKERNGRDLVIQLDQDMTLGEHHGIRDRDVLSVQENNVFGIVDSRGNQVWEAK